MTRPNPRQPAPPLTLHGVQLDQTLRSVIDELAALRLPRPILADYAIFARNPPSIVAMVARARQHADEVARFIALTQNSGQAAVHMHLAPLYALVQLNAIATVAVALMPAHTGADRFARRQQGHAFQQVLDDPQENELRFLGDLAFGLGKVDAVELTQDAIAFVGHSEAPRIRISRATTHRLEEQASLRHWLQRKPELERLLEEARRHAEMIDRFAQSLEDDDLSPRDREQTQLAQEGALLQHLIALAQIALSQVDIDTGLVLDAAHATVDTRPPLKATLLIAVAVGHHQRAMMAAHPY